MLTRADRFLQVLVRLALSLLTFTLTAGATAAVEIRTFTASELGFLVNSHLILGEEQAILVDAQFTRSEAFDVVRLIRSFDQELTTIFITRGHPEHYLGLEVITQHYPDVRVLARPAVTRAISQGGQEAIDRWQPIYLDDLPAKVVVPEAFEGDALMLGEEKIQLIDLPGANEDRATGPTLLYLPSIKTLLASDMANGQVHLWLEGVDPDAWLELLRGLGDVGPVDFVYPGHGPPAGARLLDESKKYLGTLRLVAAGRPTSTTVTPEAVVDKMKAAFPKHQLPVLLERSAKTFLRENGG